MTDTIEGRCEARGLRMIEQRRVIAVEVPFAGWRGFEQTGTLEIARRATRGPAGPDGWH